LDASGHQDERKEEETCHGDAPRQVQLLLTVLITVPLDELPVVIHPSSRPWRMCRGPKEMIKVPLGETTTIMDQRNPGSGGNQAPRQVGEPSR
jgi:hypothetical protein